MRFSEAWLREWVDPAVDTLALAEQLTMAGLEVDSVEAAGGEFSGVVIAEVKSLEKHPDARSIMVPARNCKLSVAPATCAPDCVCRWP